MSIARFTPSGHLVVEGELAPAFAGGEAAGLLALAGAWLERELPPPLSWARELAHHYLQDLCAHPDDFAVKLSGGQRDALLERVPPMPGAEYVGPATLDRLMDALAVEARASVRQAGRPVGEWLHALNPLWNTIGRVHFHLAERPGDAARPFAFLATYTTRVGQAARAQHAPLGKALEQYAGAGNRAALLSLLQPVQRGAATSPFVRALVDSGDIYHPQAWEPARALEFLKEVPACEAAGIVVRIPDWWKPHQPPRPQVRVTMGSRPPGGLGLDALLDFKVDVALDGQPLTDAEWRALKTAAGGLVKLRGRWVELDRAKLDEVLAHWKSAQAAHRQGISFLDAMRLLAGVAETGAAGDDGAPEAARWGERVAGKWLEEALASLRDPQVGDGLPGKSALAATLRPYQAAGVSWLYRLGRLGLSGCLADDMGLGKTLQVLALMARLKQDGPRAPHLLVVPASLMANWEAEAARFTPGLVVRVAHPSAGGPLGVEIADEADAVITSYGYLSRLEWAKVHRWDLVVLDEAQAIKNPGAGQTRLAKSLTARARLALTGTPIENRLGDLWSLFDFLNPGLLGGAKDFASKTRHLEKAGGEAFAPLRRLVRPYILRRLKTDRSVVADLPEKTELTAYCHLTKAQAALYQRAVDELAATLESVSGMQRRGLVLAYLTRFKQICNHPSQWTGDGRYRPEDSAKFARLTELCEPLAERQDKVLVFTQYREMTGPLSDHLAGIFGRPGLVLHGSTPVAERKKLVARFQEDEGVGHMVLSLKAGGTGLNLTAATHVIHFDRWWNPAVEDQATDRAHRIGQRRAVMVHKFTCRGTVEERIEAMLAGKRSLSRELLSGTGEVALTELTDRALIDLVRLDLDAALAGS